MNPSLWWFIGAMLLGIAEIFTLDLTFAMLAGGALAGGIVALLGLPLWASIATFGIVSALLLFVLRPALMRHFKSGSTVTGTAGSAASAHARQERRLTGRGEDGVAQQRSPATDPTGLVRPAERAVRIVEDGDRAAEDVAGRVAASHEASPVEPAVPAAVLHPPRRLLVLVTVELVRRRRTHDPQVDNRDDHTIRVDDLELWLDLDAAPHVQEPEEGLEGRL